MNSEAMSWLKFFEPAGIPYAVAILIVTALVAGFVRRTYERLGIPPSDGLLDASRSPMMQMFQRVLFAKITPNLTKVGLMDENLRDRLVAIGAIPVGG